MVREEAREHSGAQLQPSEAHGNEGTLRGREERESDHVLKPLHLRTILYSELYSTLPQTVYNAFMYSTVLNCGVLPVLRCTSLQSVSGQGGQFRTLYVNSGLEC